MDNQDEINPVSGKSEEVYKSSRVVRDKHSEGLLARVIEQQTARLPSDFFLWCSLGSMGISLYLKLTGRHENSRFVGMWASPLLIMGVYNKLVKIIGSR